MCFILHLRLRTHGHGIVRCSISVMIGPISLRLYLFQSEHLEKTTCKKGWLHYDEATEA